MRPLKRIRFTTVLLLTSLIALGTAGVRADDKRDSAGDRLPAFARMRLGSLRFQQGSAIKSLRLSADGKTVIAVGSDETARLWELRNGREVGSVPKMPLDRHEGAKQIPLPGTGAGLALAAAQPPDEDGNAGGGLLAVSRDGRTAAVATGNAIQLWDTSARRPLHRLTCKETVARFYHLAFTPDGKRLAALPVYPIAPDGPVDAPVREIFEWDVATGKEQGRLQFTAPGGDKSIPVDSFRFAPNGTHLAVWCDGTLHLCNRSTREALPVVPAPDTRLLDCAFSPDGRLLGLELSVDFLGPKEEGVNDIRRFRLIDVATGKTVRDLLRTVNDPIVTVFSPSGNVLATAERANQIRRWEVATGNELPILEHPGVGQVTWLALSADARTVALGVSLAEGGVRLRSSLPLGMIHVWDGQTGRKLHDLTGYAAQETPPLHPSIHFSPDGKTLIASGGACVRRWDVATGEELRLAEGHADEVASVAVSPDGRRLATLDRLGLLHIWDTADGRRLQTITAPPIAVLAVFFGDFTVPGQVAYAPDGKTLAVVWPTRCLAVHDAVTGRLLHRLEAEVPANLPPGIPPPPMSTASLAFLPDGKGLATGELSGRLLQWDPATGRQRHQFAPGLPFQMNGGTAYPARICVSPDGRGLAATQWTADGFRIQRWELASRKPRRPIRLERLDPSSVQGEGFVTQLAFTPDGRRLAMVIANKVLLFDWFSGREIRRLGRSATPLRGIAFSPDGKLLAAAGVDGSVHLWETATGTVLGELAGHRSEVSSVAFLPDGRTLVSAADDSTVLFWDVAAYLEARQKPSAALSEEMLNSSWKELADDNPERADQLADRLAAAPQQAVALLRRELPPAPPVDAARIARLVADLESGRFAVRDRATKELEKLGRLAETALRKRLTEKPPLDIHRRIEELLENLARPLTDPVQLRELRAVALLERIGTAEARAVLKTLADGAYQAPLTQEARGALDRLAKFSRP